MTGNSASELNDYQKMIEEKRRQNKQMLEESMAEFYKLYPDMKAEAEQARKQREAELEKTRLKFTAKLPARRKSEDPSFRVAGIKRKQSVPTRRSTRLSKSNIDFIGENDEETENDDKDTKPGKRPRLSELKTPRRSYSGGSRATQVPEIPIDKVDNSLISKIAYNSQKVYCSVKGTTCHQCRQKTTDTKSVCRSGSCVGVRGMFCGVCLRNRYGEDVAEVLKDPKWSCPPCRGDCNCSICRTREGKTPTGIIVPFIREKGYSHLREYLNKNPEDDE